MTDRAPTKPPWDQRLARPLARLLARTPATPNQVTTISLMLGVAGGIMLAQGGGTAQWGALLYMLAQFTDHIDGELARMTGQTSEFGHNYDHVAGGIFEFALFCGIGIGLEADALGGWGPVLGLIAALCVAVTVAVRMVIYRRFGSAAIDQPSWGGFEIEDIMYIVGPVAWFGGLAPFLLLASIGTPIFMIVTIREYFTGGDPK
jgi:phosphatidylglycerophosphate synthase